MLDCTTVLLSQYYRTSITALDCTLYNCTCITTLDCTTILLSQRWTVQPYIYHIARLYNRTSITVQPHIYPSARLYSVQPYFYHNAGLYGVQPYSYHNMTNNGGTKEGHAVHLKQFWMSKSTYLICFIIVLHFVLSNVHSIKRKRLGCMLLFLLGTGQWYNNCAAMCRNIVCDDANVRARW